MKIIEFSGGIFTLGETGQEVEVRPFGMAIYTVTNTEYEQFDPGHREKRNQYSNLDYQPVVYVSWEDANNYCKWLSEKTGENYRLPTEAEWEFAASGGGVRKYPWGNEKPDLSYANYDALWINTTTFVGSHPRGMTPEGLVDMAGNVWEWCSDWYNNENQHGRVVRGGSFNLNLNYLCCAARFWFIPHLQLYYLGFRVVRGPSVIRGNLKFNNSIRAIFGNSGTLEEVSYETKKLA